MTKNALIFNVSGFCAEEVADTAELVCMWTNLIYIYLQILNSLSIYKFCLQLFCTLFRIGILPNNNMV